MHYRLPGLYAITDVQLSGLSHAEQVAALCCGGATIIQLREKVLSAEEFYRQAKEALRVARGFGARVLINDRVDIAMAVEAHGVHLGQDDLPPAAARRLLGEQAIIGFSTHNDGQVRRALEEQPVDYIAIGPIFSTKTKDQPGPTVGLDGLRGVRRLVAEVPLVAIGGITLKNASEVLAAGADSVAVVSELVADAISIELRTKQFLSRL
jgi:thiamine-phosphate pyrophosphorylase